MTGDKEPIPQSGLDPRQLQLLDMFLAIGRGHETTTPGQVHAMDQAVASMKARFAEQGTKLGTDEDYFYVVAGLNVGTIWVAGILGRDPDFGIEHAINAVQVSLDRLAPADSKRFDPPTDPRAVAWYDQTAAFVKDFLLNTMGQDIENPRIFDQTAAGMTVGVEWMQGLLGQGYPPGQAAYLTCVACALIIPEDRVSLR